MKWSITGPLKWSIAGPLKWSITGPLKWSIAGPLKWSITGPLKWSITGPLKYNRSFEVEYTRSFVFIHCFTFERGRPTINRFFRNSKLNKADVLLQVIYYCDVYYFCINSFISYTLTLSWEGLAADRTGWRSALKQRLKTGEDKLMTAAADKRARRKEDSSSFRPETTHICVTCNKDCHSHFSAIGDAATTQQQINKIKKQTLGCIIHGHL